MRYKGLATAVTITFAMVTQAFATTPTVTNNTQNYNPTAAATAQTSAYANSQGGIGVGGTGGTASAGVANSGNSSSKATGGKATATTGASSSTGSTAVGQVQVEGDHYEGAKIPVSTAYAAPLTSGADTCMGSSSGGAQGPGFGLSIGTTWTDSNCMRLKNAKMMDGLGYRDVALSMMCADSTVAEAMKATGNKCPIAPEDKPVVRSSVDPKDSVYVSKNGGPDMNDVYIRSRVAGTPPFAK